MKPHHSRIASLRPYHARHAEADEFARFVHVRGAREHNLKDIDELEAVGAAAKKTSGPTAKAGRRR